MITIITLFFNFYSTTNEGIVSWSLWGSELLNMTKPFLLNEFSISRVIPRNLLSYLPINSKLQNLQWNVDFLARKFKFKVGILQNETFLLIFGAKIQIQSWNVAKLDYFVDFWRENSNKKLSDFQKLWIGFCSLNPLQIQFSLIIRDHMIMGHFQLQRYFLLSKSFQKGYQHHFVPIIIIQ